VFSLFFLSLFTTFGLCLIPYTLFWLFDYPLLHTSSLLLCDFTSNSQQEGYHFWLTTNNIPLDKKINNNIP